MSSGMPLMSSSRASGLHTSCASAVAIERSSGGGALSMTSSNGSTPPWAATTAVCGGLASLARTVATSCRAVDSPPPMPSSRAWLAVTSAPTPSPSTIGASAAGWAERWRRLRTAAGACARPRSVVGMV